MEGFDFINVGGNVLWSLPYLVELDILGNEFSGPVQLPFALYIARSFIFLALTLLKLGAARLTNVVPLVLIDQLDEVVLFLNRGYLSPYIGGLL